MAEFTYKALDARKQFVTGQLQALSLSAAVEQLIQLGYVPLSTKASTGSGTEGWRRFIPQPGISRARHNDLAAGSGTAVALGAFAG